MRRGVHDDDGYVVVGFGKGRRWMWVRGVILMTTRFLSPSSELSIRQKKQSMSC